MDRDRALRAARRAYEGGRLRASAPAGLLALPPAYLALHLPCNPGLVVLTAAGLALAMSFLLWRGQDWGRGVLPGYIVGLLALAVPLVACHSGLCPAGPGPLLLRLCFFGGLVAGLALTAMGLRELSRPYLTAGGVVACLLASLGCAVAGIGGILGMAFGFLLVAGPAWIWVRAPQR